MSLNGQIRKILSERQIRIFGVAEIRQYEKELIRFGGDIVKGYSYAVSFGIELNDAIVDGLKNRMDPNNASLYHTHAYTIINDRLNSICSLVSSHLTGRGHRTLPVPATERTDIENAIPTVSHKMIAHLAGLGWIGKNCLLITPEHGPRVRFASLLTNAPLRATGCPADQECGECEECVLICPVQAFTGRNFRDGEDRSHRFDFKRCQEYYERMKENNHRKPVCGMCLYICPYGKR